MLIRCLLVLLIGVPYVQGQAVISQIPCDLNNDECPVGSFCGEYLDQLSGVNLITCHCDSDYVVRDDIDGNCYQVMESLGDACASASNIICNAADMLTCDEDTTNECVCFGGYTEVSGSCFQLVPIDAACDIDNRILCAPANSACVNSVCVCSDPFYHQPTSGNCVQDGILGGSCDDTVMCTVANAECVQDICQCSDTFEEDDGDCVVFVDYDGSCASSDARCRDPNGACTADVCGCASSYTYDAQAELCATHVSVGQDCGDTSLCDTDNAECDIDETCSCTDGFIHVGTSCLGSGLSDGSDSGVESTEQLENSLGTDCPCEVLGSHCVELPDGNGDTHMQCVCNTAEDWYIDPANICIKDIENWDVCDHSLSYCGDANAECVLSPDNTGKYRCFCRAGYVDVNGTCAKKITTLQDPNCADCLANDGICYDDVLDDLVDQRTGCKCLQSANGENCDNVLLAVTCDSDPFQMVVCYDPHSGYDFLGGIALMYVDNHGTVEECKGVYITDSNDDYCSESQVRLVLPLDEENRSTCGTTNMMADISTRRYENTLAVQASPTDFSSRKLFNMFCSYSTSTNVGGNGVGVVGIPGNDRGQHQDPDITVEVLDHLGQEVPDDMPLRLGDKIRLRIKLADDGVYSALRVEYSAASSAASPTDADAAALQLTLSGCPWVGQTIIDGTNNWDLTTPGDVHSVETGLFQVFALSEGSTVFIHCMVKLCLTGDEDDCAPYSCDLPSPHESYGRRKRDTQGDAMTEVVQEIIWYTEEEEEGVLRMEQSTFTAIVCVLVLLLLVFIILALVMLWRLCLRQKITEDMPPQRFALPRMNNNPHTRFQNPTTTSNPNLRI